MLDLWEGNECSVPSAQCWIHGNSNNFFVSTNELIGTSPPRQTDNLTLKGLNRRAESTKRERKHILKNNS